MYPNTSNLAFCLGVMTFAGISITFANSLDPDQAQQNVKSNLDRNRLAF